MYKIVLMVYSRLTHPFIFTYLSNKSWFICILSHVYIVINNLNFHIIRRLSAGMDCHFMVRLLRTPYYPVNSYCIKSCSFAYILKACFFQICDRWQTIFRQDGQFIFFEVNTSCEVCSNFNFCYYCKMKVVILSSLFFGWNMVYSFIR